MNARLIVGVIALSFFYADGKTAFGQEANNGGGATDGAACKVTAGPNAGKTGKYTEGGTWCEGDWGGTECKDSSGNSKCSPARTRPVFSPATLAMLQGYLEATAPDAKPGAVKNWGTKYKAKVLKKSKESMTISFAQKTLTFDGGREGLSRLFTKQP
ncbi:MAG TPA: hypothetical protein VNZ47_09690 [Candidatus Dormibacteraeota bacterium]|jgi:hypothetical protein|nr:hypothetical protein [Candidatus Dormibacteraeota bacterium]